MDNYEKLTRLIHDRIKKDPVTAARVIVGLCKTINAEFTHVSVEESEKEFKSEGNLAERIHEIPLKDIEENEYPKNIIIKSFYKYKMYNETLRMTLSGSGYYKSFNHCSQKIISKNPGYDVISIDITGLEKVFIND